TVQNFPGIDVLNFNIDKGVAFLLVPSNVLDTELQNILIPDGICDHIFMQAISKKVFGSSFSQIIFRSIFGKDGGACKTEQLTIIKKSGDLFMRLPKLTPVAFVKNENNTLVL